ncbi:dynamin family protein [Klebsormidium nitens]|uniref:Dynamin family protein n=1 Tax=Klebsormidium nitens TaxID=105231 RepID=A0A1Y1ITI2_KLENI|nr:dynamin family protein [Klebsormidium nitens]|eukprot:GAQ92126.1 dynamin family protein [Klebsormidium nitens]
MLNDQQMDAVVESSPASSMEGSPSNADAWPSNPHSWASSDHSREDNDVAAAQGRLQRILDQFNMLHGLPGLAEEGINIPAVVVVGEQSHGKSTVLSRILGINLPAKSGMCTRIPLFVKLRDNKAARGGPDQIISFEWQGRDALRHHPNISERDIPELVNRATRELAGSDSAISATAATLTVLRRGTPDLNLIDLPGMVALAGRGAPESICTDIKNLIIKYAEKKESIMLAVMPADSDTQIHHSLALARELDPKGDRTLAVLTKCDKAAPDGLLERVEKNDARLRLGYALLRNPEIREGRHMDFAQGIKDEETFFNNHASTLQRLQAPNTLGIQALVKSLVKLQEKIINEQLPEIHRRIQEALEQRRRERSLLPPFVSNNADAIKQLYAVTTKRSNRVERLVRDDLSDYPGNEEMKLLKKFRQECNDAFAKEILADVGPCTGILTRAGGEKLRDLAMQDRPMGLPGMVKKLPFNNIFRQLLSACEANCQNLLTRTRGFVETIARQVLADSFDSATTFPVLQERLLELQVAALETATEHCREFICRIIEKERTTPNGGFTNHPLYSAILERLMLVIHEKSTVEAGEGDHASPLRYSDLRLLSGDIQAHLEQLRLSGLNFETKELQVELFAYWYIVSNRLMDVVPMELYYAFKNALLTDFDRAVMTTVATDLEALKHMMQDATLADKHARMTARIKDLTTAMEVLRT